MNDKRQKQLLADVQALVDGPLKTEFKYQNSRAVCESWAHKGVPTVPEELLLLEEYIGRARTAWVDLPDDNPALHVVRKVAAIALRCLANHECPERYIPSCATDSE